MTHNKTNYQQIIAALDDETLYTATSIAIFAKAQGQLEDPQEQTRRVRLFFHRRALAAGFPADGDGKLSGHAAWLGKRWKAGS